jgi:hypothetical protein
MMKTEHDASFYTPLSPSFSLLFYIEDPNLF